MTWLDYAVIGVLVLSVAWGLWRGLVHEILSILGYVIAFLSANLLAGPLGPSMPEIIPSPELRVLAAFVGVFILALVAVALVTLVLTRLVRAVGLGALDRTLGGAFGVVRAIVIVVAAALLAGLTPAPRQPFWRDSVCGEPMTRAALALKPWLPATLAERLRYD